MSDPRKHVKHVQIVLSLEDYRKLQAAKENYGLPSMQKLIEMLIRHAYTETPDLTLVPKVKTPAILPTTMTQQSSAIA